MRSATFASVACGLLVAACSGATSSELFEPSGEHPREQPGASGAREQVEPAATETGGDTGAVTARGGDVEPSDDAAAPEVDASTQREASDDDAGPPRCDEDAECSSGICNSKTDRCTAPGTLGEPCGRDLECQGKLCNTKLEACSPRLPKGGACGRNTECSSGGCRLSTMTCG
jgi:hypothetical protein